MISNRVFSVVKFIYKKNSCSLRTLRSSSLVVPQTQVVIKEPLDLIEKPPQNELRDVETIEDTPTYFTPTFNFAAYVNKSETLKKFVELGVDLSKIEMRKGLAQYVLKLDFENDVKNHLLFLHDLKIPAEEFGNFITKNPLIFKESLDDMETRVYYLRAKNFTMDQVRDIVIKNPYWLSFTTKRIDRRLGWFQKNFKLTGNEIRQIVHSQPKLITFNMEHIRESTFAVKEEMGFDEQETKALLLMKPRYWMNSKDASSNTLWHFIFFTNFRYSSSSSDPQELVERFDFIHNVMKLSHDQILKAPYILSSRQFRLKQRFGFLKFIGKAQLDETKPGYISLKSFVEGTDKEFVLNVCNSSIETYDNFLKTL